MNMVTKSSKNIQGVKYIKVIFADGQMFFIIANIRQLFLKKRGVFGQDKAFLIVNLIFLF
jgi:hypothetical protein